MGKIGQGRICPSEPSTNTIVTTHWKLDQFCSDCDFVFNLAGVNRPQDPKEFKEGNFGFASTLLDTLKKHHNTCPVILSSSLQATLAGRFGTSVYGLSKREFMSIASQTSWASGYAQTITLRSG